MLLIHSHSFSPLSDVVFEKAYCEYRLNRVESSLKTIESASHQTDKLKELYGQVVRHFDKTVILLQQCKVTLCAHEVSVVDHCLVERSSKEL